MSDSIIQKKRWVHSPIPVLIVALLLASVVALALTAKPSWAAITLTVNSTADATDGRPGDGKCLASNGKCTLRAAIQESNARAGADVVKIPTGEYALAIPEINENGIESGDLDIVDDLTITGAGNTKTIIDGGVPKAGSSAEVRGLDRLFEIHPTASEVTISHVKIQDGYDAEYGGGILNAGNANVTLQRSWITNSVAGKTGGAIDNHASGTVNVKYSTVSRSFATGAGSAINNNQGGTLNIANSSISNNQNPVSGTTAPGGFTISNNAELNTSGTITATDSKIQNNLSGGIDNAGAGTVTVERTTISGNRSEENGGAINNASGSLTVKDSTISGNSADNGGGINNEGGINLAKGHGEVEISNTTFSGNTASANGGGVNNGLEGSTTITGGSFSGNTASDGGGGLQNGDKGSVAVSGATFTDNTAISGGGFANNGDGQVSVENSDFLRNKAPQGDGGGLYSDSDGAFSLTGGTFSENEAFSGGGFANTGDGTAMVSGTKFSTNTAGESGGGILVTSGNVTMSNIDVVGNSSNATLEGGAGIAYHGDAAVSLGESATIEDSRILDNTAKGDGGGLDSRGDGNLGISTTTIKGNTAARGGAINHVGDAPLEVRRSTLSGNRAEAPASAPGSSGEVGSGGGIFTDGDGEATLENTTVSGNTATIFGGGLTVSSRLTLHNNTVTNNSAASGGGINNGGGDLVGDGLVFMRNNIVAKNLEGGNCAGTMISEGNNIENSNTCGLNQGGDQINTDPGLALLADNGGPTLTHPLLVNSPAIDGADASVCPATDQRDVERPQGGGCDVGAFERAPTDPVPEDPSPPTIKSVAPADGSTGRDPATTIRAAFSKSMDPATINTSSFVVSKQVKSSTGAISWVKISGTVTYTDSNKLATFTPSAPLARGTKYKANVNTLAKDLAGNQLDTNPTLAGPQGKVWYFTVIS